MLAQPGFVPAHLPSLEPEGLRQGKGSGPAVLEPFLRIRVAEVHHLAAARMPGHIGPHGRTVHHDGIEAPRVQEPPDGPGELGRVEVAEGCRSRAHPVQGKAGPAGGLGNPAHVQVMAVAVELLAGGQLVSAPRQGGHGDLVADRQTADHVERADLASPLGRIGKPVAKEEDFHAEANGAPSGA